MSKETKLPEQQPIILSVNTVIDGVFYRAGDPLPVSAENLPDSLRPFVVTDSEPEPAEESKANFELGVTYQMTSEGHRGRALGRQAAQLQADAERQAEEELSTPLAPEIEEALEDQHEEAVGFQIAEAEIRAKWRDAAHDAAGLPPRR
jgi:hypothetical protein